MLILDPNDAASQTKLAKNTKKGLYEGTHIDADDKKVYNPKYLKHLQRVELHTIVEEDLTGGKSVDARRNQANKVEAQLHKIMYGDDSKARERELKGPKVNNKRKERSKLSDVKQRGRHARSKLMAGASAKSERDEEAEEEEEGGSYSSMDQVEAEEGPMREQVDSE
jgi:hypothetical protein